MSAGAGPVLDVAGLVVDFAQRRRWENVVDGVSFAIARGEILGLAGESGCGKSTIAYALLGERRPGSRIRAGRIVFCGADILMLPAPALRALRGARISFVSQNPATSLTPSLRVGEQIVETLLAHGAASGRRAALERTMALLSEVGLPEPERLAGRYPHQLSGGQQQRVVIAMALSCRPDLIVLDEPTTGLDVTTQQRILDLLAHMRESVGSAMLYVSHDLGALSQICDRIAVMYAGALVEVAPVDRLFEEPLHPYTRGLIASVPQVSHPPTRELMLRGLMRRSELPAGCRFARRCGHCVAQCATTAQSLEPARTSHLVACSRWREVAATTAPAPAVQARTAARS